MSVFSITTAARSVSGTTSWASLKASNQALYQALRRYERSTGAAIQYVPNYDGFQYGDVILERAQKPTERRKWDRTVEGVQQKWLPEAASDCWRWTHAMLYVGDGHVVESHPNRRRSTRIKIGGKGTQFTPFDVLAQEKEYLLLRCKDPDFQANAGRFRVARHALIKLHMKRRNYGYLRAIRIGVNSAKPPNLEEGIICSEYVLECFAIGSQVLVPQWAALQQRPPKPFTPAHFAAAPEFEEVPVTWNSLERRLGPTHD